MGLEALRICLEYQMTTSNHFEHDAKLKTLETLDRLRSLETLGSKPGTSWRGQHSPVPHRIVWLSTLEGV